MDYPEEVNEGYPLLPRAEESEIVEGGEGKGSRNFVGNLEELLTRGL